MEQIINKCAGLEYECRFEKNNNISYVGKIIPYCEQSDGKHLYQDNDNSNYYDEFSDKCRVMFEFNINWRGCWDNRIYFKDTEYWGEEMEDMNKVYEFIRNHFQEMLINERPEHAEFMKKSKE